MKIEKIKSVNPKYGESCGPFDITTLGFKIGDISFILGEYYGGPYMIPEHGILLDKTEKAIDELCSGSLSAEVELVEQIKQLKDEFNDFKNQISKVISELVSKIT